MIFLLIAELNVKFHKFFGYQSSNPIFRKIRKVHEIEKTIEKSGQWILGTELHRCRSQCSTPSYSAYLSIVVVHQLRSLFRFGRCPAAVKVNVNKKIIRAFCLLSDVNLVWKVTACYMETTWQMVPHVSNLQTVTIVRVHNQQYQ